MSGPEERQRAVDLCLTTPMTTVQVVEHLGHPTRQCLERWLAKDPRYAGHMDRPIILMETQTKAIEPVPGGMRQKRAAERLGAGLGAVRNRVRAYREGGMAALRPENRDAGQADRPAMRRDRSAGDAEAPRRRVEEPELGNAVMREVAEARRKRPGRRPAAPVEQGRTLLVDRLRPEYSPGPMTCLPGPAPGSHHCHHARLGVDRYAGLRTEVAEAFASSKGRYGYRRIMAEDGLTAHVPRRLYLVKSAWGSRW
ncbi:hypothetical protein QM008_05990 [Bifidobacterium angulatum]|uniref:hypothetical protein n=1 Tax=Bifidobacterium angulatum TaxID=1683 RepID=UPI00406C0351